MNTDKLSTGGASPSAKSKKREEEKRKSPCTSVFKTGSAGVELVGKMECGCEGRGIAQEYAPRPKAEPRSGRGVRSGG